MRKRVVLAVALLYGAAVIIACGGRRPPPTVVVERAVQSQCSGNPPQRPARCNGGLECATSASGSFWVWRCN